MGAEVSPEEIVVTAGALEALNLALQVVTAPNDIIAIESPSFYGCLQAIEGAGRRVVEIPTSPEQGVDLDALERTLDRVPVKACWFMTTFHNPLGASLSAVSKQRLVQMLAAREIPLIEDNVYSELYFERERPQDHQGLGPRWTGPRLRFICEEPRPPDTGWVGSPPAGLPRRSEIAR